MNDFGRSMHLFRVWNRVTPVVVESDLTGIVRDRKAFSGLPDSDCLVSTRRRWRRLDTAGAGCKMPVSVKSKPKSIKSAKRLKGGRTEKSFRSVLCELSPRCAVVRAPYDRGGRPSRDEALRLKRQRILGARERRFCKNYKRVLTALSSGRLQRSRFLRRQLFRKLASRGFRRRIYVERGKEVKVRRAISLADRSSPLVREGTFGGKWLRRASGHDRFKKIHWKIEVQPTRNFNGPYSPSHPVSESGVLAAGRWVKLTTLRPT